MAIASRGARMAVDWEQRVDFARLRAHRLARAKATLAASDLGALLLLTPTTCATSRAPRSARGSATRTFASPCCSVRTTRSSGTSARRPNTTSSTAVAAGDELARMGAADARRDARLDGRSGRARRTRGARAARAGPSERADRRRRARLHDGPRARAPGDPSRRLPARDARGAAPEERDELALLDQAAGIVDAVYEEIYTMLRPGVTESQVVAAAMKLLFELGSEHVEAINAISGDRCCPTRTRSRTACCALATSVSSTSSTRQRLPDVLLPHVQCRLRDARAADRLRRCREWLDASIALVRPGSRPTRSPQSGRRPRSSACRRARGVRATVRPWPRRRALREPDDLAPALLRGPITLEPGMVFALETYCAAEDGRSAARIEEEVVVTEGEPLVLTPLPRRRAPDRRQELRARRGLPAPHGNGRAPRAPRARRPVADGGAHADQRRDCDHGRPCARRHRRRGGADRRRRDSRSRPAPGRQRCRGDRRK